MTCLTMNRPRCWTRWATSKTTAPDLSYRWSCRMAICGSCGMMVNKVPKLACKTFLRDYTKGIKVEALANFPIERDLVVDMTHFIESRKPLSRISSAITARLTGGQTSRPRPRWRHQRHQGGGIGQLPVERDLVVDMTHFYRKLEAIKPYIIGNNRTPDRGQTSRPRPRWRNTISFPAASTAGCAMPPVHSSA